MGYKSLVAAAGFTLLLGASAQAGGTAAYSPQDIVKFFATQEATRGICVGTETQCGVTDKKPAGFNLRLTFGKDSSVLSPDDQASLNAFAEALKSPSLSVATMSIEGHTDATGSDKYNLSLSQRRADAVVSYLAGHGVDATRLKSVGLGKSAPLGTDPFDPANRRVETKLVIE